MNTKFASLVLPTRLTFLDYAIPQDMILIPGQYAEVPLRGKVVVGVVFAVMDKSDVPKDKLKEVLRALPFHLPEISCTFAKWVAEYTLAPIGSVLKMVVPDMSYLEPLKKQPILPPLAYQGFLLNPEQQDAAQYIRDQIKGHKWQASLLEGVTGSGKTEVYFEGIDETLKQGKQALVLMPEITLTSAWLQRFEQRFGAPPTLWHSGLTPKQRKENWSLIQQGKAQVIIGARSALFLPYPNLGFIVVDEEHDPSYKQESGVFYHGRDMAILRAKLGNFPIVLASATPSLETLYNIETKNFHHKKIMVRHGNASLPAITLIDMKKQHVPKGLFISPPLWKALRKTVEAQEQALLFLNRRGFAPIFLCQSCGEKETCENCDLTLVFHKKKGCLLCHHCGFSKNIPPTCGACGATDSFVSHGPGVERLQEELQQMEPTWRLQIMSSDTLSTPKKTKALLDAIENQEVDVIIGTQSMAKGHHFPNLTLVGVIDGDAARMALDIRGNERLYQLLSQVAGRAGRSTKKGRVLIQAYNPENTALQALEKGLQDAFLNHESQERKALCLPPFGRMSAFIISGKREKETQAFVQQLAQHFKQQGFPLRLLGPAPAPLYFVNQWYRWRCLVSSPKEVLHQHYLKAWSEGIKPPHDIKIQLDIDPFSFM